MLRLIPMCRNVMLVALACAACGGDSAPGAEKPSDAKKQELAQNAKETMQSAKELLAAKQQEFQKAADQKLKELDPKIQELKQKAKNATGEAKAQLEKLAASLEDERKAAAEELARWKDVGADAWQSFTSKLSKKLDDLERAAKDATSK